MSEGDLIIENGVLTGYGGPGGEVILPEGLKAVGARVFRNRADLRRVVLPKGCESIGSEAFAGCAGLREAVLREGLEIIGPDAFLDCSSLRELSLPKGLRRIRERSFCACTGLSRVVFREGLASIGEAAFMGCASLRAAELPEGLESFGRAVFAGCAALERAVLPGTLSFVWEEAFSGCASLRTLVLPEGVAIIGARVFSGCRSLEVLDLPESLTGLRNGAFSGCRSLRSLRLPRGVAELGDRAFADCRGLRSLDLPEGLRRIGAGAFADCRALKTVDLPKGLRRIGHGAFADCSSLRSVRLPEDVEFIGDGAFARCPALADGEGFLAVGGILFGYSGASAAASVPDGVTRIVRGAFPARSGFLDIRLPESVTEAEEGAFPRERFILRIPRWFPGLAPALRDREFFLLSAEDDADVPPRFRRAVRLGAALLEPGTPDGELRPEVRRWYARFAGSLRREAFELPALRRFLFAHRFLSPVDAERWLEEARAQESVELTALLMGYLNDLGPEKVEKARERKLAREVNAAAARARRLSARRPEDGVAGLCFIADPSVQAWPSNAELRRWLAPLGAKLGRTLNDRTDYLVTGGPGADSELTRAAADLGVPVITARELRAMAGLPKQKGRKRL